MAQAHFEIYDPSGNLLLDLADAVAGNVQIISTGKSNGSYTVTTTSGEFVEFAYYVLIQSPPGSGQPSPFPQITVTDNVVAWAFDSSGSSTNTSVDIIAFLY